jgi:hypothetical protein
MVRDVNDKNGSLIDVLNDRRRPGRIDVSPELIPLLRETASADAELFVHPEEASDQLSAARGIIAAVLPSIIMWAIIGLMLWLLL